ncbi:TonB-dependent receptor [Massilia sp. PWRC2]|uniref:TonB-dependent receptor n=1 Tax=Massilia sp. PWRC2 TaxID=2804626 RepID=UPI003CF50F5D
MFRKTVVARALTIAFSTAALSAAVMSPAVAQSNATGNILGNVGSPAGVTVNVLNVDTGLKRSITPEANGRYQATALPTGRYKVELVRAGAVVNTINVEVLVGQGVDASFASGTEVQAVQITGRRSRIDVSNTTNGATFTARELKALPIAPSVGAIIQLTPGTTRGDSRYGDINAPSIGGASASENSFYVNGFPVTNVLLQVGAAELPFGAIANAQILSGGYGAEFGRATGGVSNITTKSGTNNWEIGAQAYISPNNLRAKEKNIYYPTVGKPGTEGTDGKIYLYNNNNTAERKSGSVSLGGPLIKDTLFMFVDYESIKGNFADNRVANTVPSRTIPYSNGWETIANQTERYLVKLDWNITDNHRLEYTQFGDTPKSDRKYYSYDFNTHAVGATQTSGQNYTNWGPTPAAAAQGGEFRIGKYTGNLTDNLTLTAMYGDSIVKHSQSPFGFVPGVFQTSVVTGGNAAGIKYPGIDYALPQPTTGTLLAPGAQDKQRVYRIDAEYKLGNHLLRAGLDHNDISSLAGVQTAGGGSWIYDRLTNPNATPASNSNSPASGGGLGTQGYFVSKNLLSRVSTPTVEQAAQYVEDKWQINKDVLFVAGLRNEQFTNYNGDHLAYYSQRHQLAPRLGVSWDVMGDSSTKLYANGGRYHLQIPTNVAVRGAGSSLQAVQYYTYTGVNPATGEPTGLNPISALVSPNNEFGQAKDPRTVAAQNMKSHYQDEVSIGFDKQLTPEYTIGGKATYRTLKSTVDDFCDARPFYKYATDHKIDISKYEGFNCALFNPGIANDFLVEYAGPGNALTPVHLSAADLGYDKVVRTYKAVDLSLEHGFRNGWYAKVNYTWSRSYGNTEGQTLSDIGQADVATTQVFDFPEIGLNSAGLTPNNRTHQIKAFGYYEITPQFSLGGNALLSSGRPKNCIGNLPDSYGPLNPARDYGSAFFFCDGVATPRGSQGNLSWDTRLDMNFAYKPAFMKDFMFKIDVYNVFNKQTVQNISEIYNSNAANVSTSFGRVISYTAPRSARLTAEFNHKF